MEFQGWHILPNDKTLKLALSHSKRRYGISDISEYQKDQLVKALKRCKSFRNSIDIGAHYGLMSYHMSESFENVYSFEIEPSVRRCLEINMDKFGCDNVKVYPCGVGESNKLVGINFAPKGKTFGTHINNDALPMTEIKSIDSFGFKDIDFIKIDAEGYEPYIIDGAIDTIKKYKPVILYERKGHEKRYGRGRHSVLKKLSKLGYKDLIDVGNKNGVIGIR